MARRKVTIRPSKARLALWVVCAIVAAWLAVDMIQRAPKQLAGQDRMVAAADAEAEDAARATSRGAAPPAVRIGLMPRAAHLVVLSGLEMNLYHSAAVEDGAVEVNVFDRSRGLAAALRDDQIDVACVPLRVAAELRAAHGERAPVVVAGVSRSDERYVVRRGLAAFETLPFGPLRIGVLEAPALDISRALGIDGDDAPTVLLVAESAAARQLASRELDLALLPEPLAAQAAALSGSSVDDARAVPAHRIVGGAVLVATARFAAEEPELLERLVMTHLVSTVFVQNDVTTAIERAITLLNAVGAEVPPALFWGKAADGASFDAEIPTEALTELLELTDAGPIDALVDRSFLDAARSGLEADDDGG